MRKMMVLGLVAALLMIPWGGAAAQDEAARGQAAQIRFANFFYQRAQVGADDEPVVRNLTFSHVSDYQPLDGGTHTLAVRSMQSEGGTVEQFDLTAGHSYVLIATGDWNTDEAPTLMLFDETEIMAGLDPQAQRVMFISLVKGAPAVDGYVNGELVSAGVQYAQMVPFDAPAGTFEAKFTLAGVESMVLFQSSYVSVPQGVTLTVAAGTSVADMFMALHTRSTLSITDYLAVMSEEGGNLSRVNALVTAAGLEGELSAEGPLTVFAPSDWTFEELPMGAFEALLTDPAALAETLRGHIVAGYYPPMALWGTESLTALNGSTLAFSFPEDDWWKINGEISIYDDVRLSNGVIYYIGGLLAD